MGQGRPQESTRWPRRASSGAARRVQNRVFAAVLLRLHDVRGPGALAHGFWAWRRSWLVRRRPELAHVHFISISDALRQAAWGRESLRGAPDGTGERPAGRRGGCRIVILQLFYSVFMMSVYPALWLIDSELRCAHGWSGVGLKSRTSILVAFYIKF